LFQLRLGRALIASNTSICKPRYPYWNDGIQQGPPAAGTLSLDTAYLSNNFASLAGTNTAVQAAETLYSRPVYTYSAPGGTVAVDGLSGSALNGASGDKTGWDALSNTVKYIIYAAAGVVALIVIVSFCCSPLLCLTFLSVYITHYSTR
jgi:hypothetical protein